MAFPAAAPGWCAPSLSAPTFCFAPGKTWFMPVTYLQRGMDGTAGAPVNLSGGVVSGILYTRGNLTGIPLTIANGGVTIDPLNGVMSFLVRESITAGFVADNIPPFADSYNYPLSRLEVDFRDSLGHLDVAAVFPIFVFDPRFVDPGAFPLGQAGTIVSGGPQGVAGPAGVVSINGQTGAEITLGAHDVGTLTAEEITGDIAAATSPLKTAVATLNSEVAGLLGQPTVNAYSKADVDAQEAALQAQITSLASKVDSLITALGVAQTTIATLQRSMASMSDYFVDMSRPGNFQSWQ